MSKKIPQSISNVHTGDIITYKVKYPEKLKDYYTIPTDLNGTVSIDGDSLEDVIYPDNINPITITGKKCEIPFFLNVPDELQESLLIYFNGDENGTSNNYIGTYGKWIKAFASSSGVVNENTSSKYMISWSASATYNGETYRTETNTIPNMKPSSTTEYIIGKELLLSDFKIKNGELRLIQYSNYTKTDIVEDSITLYRNDTEIKTEEYTVNSDNIITVKNCEENDIIKFVATRTLTLEDGSKYNTSQDFSITITSDMINNPNKIELKKFDFNDFIMDIVVKDDSNNDINSVEFYYADTQYDQQYINIYTKIFPTLSYSANWIKVYEDKVKYWDPTNGCYKVPIWVTSKNTGTTNRSFTITISAEGYEDKTITVTQLAPILVTLSFAPSDNSYTIASNLDNQYITFDAATVVTTNQTIDRTGGVSRQGTTSDTTSSVTRSTSSVSRTTNNSGIKPKYSIFVIRLKGSSDVDYKNYMQITNETEPKIYIINKSKVITGTYTIIVTASITDINEKIYKYTNASEITDTFVATITKKYVRTVSN